MIANLLQVECAYINTSHPDFVGGAEAVARLIDAQPARTAAAASRAASPPRQAIGAGASYVQQLTSSPLTAQQHASPAAAAPHQPPGHGARGASSESRTGAFFAKLRGAAVATRGQQQPFASPSMSPPSKAAAAAAAGDRDQARHAEAAQLARDAAEALEREKRAVELALVKGRFAQQPRSLAHSPCARALELVALFWLARSRQQFII